MQNLCRALLVSVMQHQLRSALHSRWRLCLPLHSCAAAWAWTRQCCPQPCSRTASAAASRPAILVQLPCNKALQHQRMQPRRGLRLCPAPRQRRQHTAPSRQQTECPPPLPAAQRPLCLQAHSPRLCHLLARALRLVSVVRACRRKQTQLKPRSSVHLPGAPVHIQDARWQSTAARQPPGSMLSHDITAHCSSGTVSQPCSRHVNFMLDP